MSESVQLGNLGPRLVPAGRPSHGGKEPDRDFDAELGNLDSLDAQMESANTAGKSASGEIEGDGDDANAPKGGHATLLAHLFDLGDKPARKHDNGQSPKLDVHKSAKKERQPPDDKADDDNTLAPVTPVFTTATFANAPAVQAAAPGLASDGKTLSGKASTARVDDTAAQILPKGDAPAGNGKEASDRIANASEPDGPKPAAVKVDPEAAKDEADGRQERNALAKVKVIDVQTAPAPAASSAQLPSSTVAALARAIHSGMASESSAAQAAAAATDKPAAPGAIQTLKIQLTPVSLGTVTAQLRLSGESLHVDLQVDNAEAHRRLKSDSDTIVKSLRALGYDVDRITIQALPPAQHTAGANNAASSNGREQSFQQAAGDSGNGQGSSHAGNGRGHGQGSPHQPAERPEQHSSSRGIYI